MEPRASAITLKVLGSLEVFDSQGGRLGVKGRSLLLRLWAAGQGGISRTQAGRDLWPDDGPTGANAKLRVALGRLKQSLPEGLILERDGVLSLRVDLVASDYEMGVRALEAALDEVDPKSAIATASSIFRWLESPFLPEAEDPWLMPIRASWDELREEAAACLLEQAKEVGASQEVFLAAQAGLKMNPVSPLFAEAGVLALIQMGDLKGAAGRLKSWEHQAKEIDPSFALPPRIKRLVKGQIPSSMLSDEQMDFAAGLVERLIQEDPEAALEFLGHRLFRREVQTRPEAALPLLEKALSASELVSESSHRCLGRAALAAGLIQDHDKAIRYGERALNLAQSPLLRKAILISLSFDYFWQGRTADALATVDQAIVVADRIGDQIDCEIAKCQRASFWMLGGRLGEAVNAFDHAIAELIRLGAVENLPDMVTLLHNAALALAHSSRWEEADERLNELQVYYQIHQPKHLLPLLTPLRGLVLFMKGEKKKGAGILAKGVAVACRNRAQKQVGTALLMAAMVLAEAQKAVEAGFLLSSADAELARERALPSEPRRVWIEELKLRAVQPQKPLTLVESCRLAVAELRKIESGG